MGLIQPIFSYVPSQHLNVAAWADVQHPDTREKGKEVTEDLPMHCGSALLQNFPFCIMSFGPNPQQLN